MTLNANSEYLIFLFNCIDIYNLSTYEGGLISIWQYLISCAFFLPKRSRYISDLCHMKEKKNTKKKNRNWVAWNIQRVSRTENRKHSQRNQQAETTQVILGPAPVHSRVKTTCSGEISIGAHRIQSQCSPHKFRSQNMTLQRNMELCGCWLDITHYQKK